MQVPDLTKYYERSSARHNHLCPRQILGVRIGAAGASALGLEPHRADKRLLVILETDGCFADGVEAATGCTIGHRTLRVEDYGKIAATFVDGKKGTAIWVARAGMCVIEPMPIFRRRNAIILPSLKLTRSCRMRNCSHLRR